MDISTHALSSEIRNSESQASISAIGEEKGSAGKMLAAMPQNTAWKETMDSSEDCHQHQHVHLNVCTTHTH